MKEVIESMKKRAVVLKKALEKAGRESGPFPEGHLRISVDAKCARYYRVTEKGDSNGEYIKQSDHKLAVALARKDYNRRFLEDAQFELSRLEQAISSLSKTNADLSYLRLSEPRRKLIDPYIATDELFAAEWQARPVKPAGTCRSGSSTKPKEARR